MMLSTSLALIAGTALAHHPHDPVNLFDISSDFTNDQIALGTRYPAQNWRPLELVTSTDGAFTWHSLPAGLDNASEYVSFQLSPQFHLDGVAMMATLNEGAFVSTDGGASWSATLTDRNLDLGVVGHDGTTAVLLVHELNGPLWRSTDLGVTWDTVTAPPNVAAISAFDNYAALGNGNTVYTSSDAGLTWDAGQDVGGQITDVSIGPQGTTMAGSERGAFLSVAGAPFTRIDAFATKITTVGVSPSWPDDPVLMASKELQGVWVSEDGGTTWELRPTGILPSDQSEVHYYDFRFSRDFANDGIVFSNLWEGLAISHDRGQSWVESDTRPPGMITGIAISPNYADDHQVVVGSFDAGAWYTDDGGESWTVVNNGLTKSSTYDLVYRSDADGPRVMMGMRAHLAWGRPPFDSWEFADLPTEGYTTRVALSPDFASDGIALAATRVDGVLRTADGGQSWDYVTDKLSAISSIAWDEGGVVLFGLKTGHLFRSDDHGATFVDVPQIPLAPHPVFVAVSDEGFLVGTGRGLYTTDLNAQIYTPVSELPGAIHQVAASPGGTLFAAVRGGGLYRSEGGAPFEQIGADLTAEGPPHEMQVSPTFDRDDTLFAAIDERMYRSTDRGESWTRVDPTPVRYEEDAQSLIYEGRNTRQGGEATASVNAQNILLEGSSVTLDFVGIGVGWIGSSGGGRGQIEIDGVVVDTIDTELGDSPSNQTFELELFRSEELPLERHRITLTAVEGEIGFDGFDVYPRAQRTATFPPTDGTTSTADTGAPTDPTTQPPTDGGETDKGGCGCASGPGPAAALWLFGLVGLLARRR